MKTNIQKRSFLLAILFAFICIPLFSQGGLIKKRDSDGNNNGDGCDGTFNSDEFTATFIIPFANLEGGENGFPSNFPCDLALQINDNLGSTSTISLSNYSVYDLIDSTQILIVEHDISLSTIEAACFETGEENIQTITLDLQLICMDGSDPCEESVTPSIYVNGDCDYDTSIDFLVCCENTVTGRSVTFNDGSIKSVKNETPSSVIIRNQFGEIIKTLKEEQLIKMKLNDLGLNSGLYYITTITDNEILTKLYYQIE